MENLTVKIEGDTKVLEIRTGDALKLFNPKPLTINGNIAAPANYVSIRGTKKETDHVTFSREDMRITFYEKAKDEFGNVVIGKLLMNPDLEKFGINKGTERNTTDLAKFLKMNRMFFKDKSLNFDIVTALNSFKANTVKDEEIQKGDRGNMKASVEKRVNSNVPEKFTLRMPIFVGGVVKEFEVEICFNSRDIGVSIWLESPELQELIIHDRDDLIDDEIERLRETGIVIIEQ